MLKAGRGLPIRSILYLLRRRNPAPIRRHRGLRARWHRGGCSPGSGGRGGHHVTVELPHGHCSLENCARAGLWQCGGLEAGQPGSGLRRGAGGDHFPPGFADQGLVQPCDGQRRARRPSADRKPLVKAITFTGSVDVGKGIARSAVENLTRIQLEMGSKNALVVMDDARSGPRRRMRTERGLWWHRSKVHRLFTAGGS